MAKKHEDFGEKIGGARKDLWKERGLMSGDLTDMTDREAEKYVTKANVWPTPDYDAMLAGGVALPVAFFIKTIRDAAASKPVYLRTDAVPELRAARRAQYVDFIRNLADAAEGIRTEKDAEDFFDGFFVKNGFVIKETSGISPRYEATPKCCDFPCISNKLLNTALRTNMYRLESQAKKKQFGVAKADKLPAGYSVHENSDGTYFAAKKHCIIGDSFATRGEAVAAVRNNAQETRRGTQKTFTPPQLKDVQRVGPEYRHGMHVEGRDYMGAFGFRGGEFGNWVSQKERQANLDMGFDALKDLARVLGIEDTDIALDGTLAIAFGSRGHGNAVAHYEPLRQVINLTKMRGAGSLAHEWWHALDDFLGAKAGAGGMLSENCSEMPEMNTLVMRMYCDDKKRPTEFLAGSSAAAKTYKKDGGYWTSRTEMSARAFACYVMDKLGEDRDDYLAGHAESAKGKDWQAYPVGEERERINEAFDALFEALKKNGTFHKRSEDPRPEAADPAPAAVPVWEPRVPAFTAEACRVQLCMF